MSVEEIKISILESVGGSAAVSSEDGDLLFDKISNALNNKIVVMLDFNNLELITSTFLNASIGQLYSEFDSDYLNAHLKLINISEDDLALLKKVIQRAKEYFKNKEEIEKSIENTFENA